MRRFRRANERSLDGPLRLRQGDLPRLARALATNASLDDYDVPPRRYTFERLLSVDLRHTYFNRSEGRCPALVCRPTAATAATLRDLGLLFRDEGTAFSVLYDFNRRAQLLKAMERREKAGQWTWLSFVLIPDTPFFVNFTDLPSDFQPASDNLYFSNRQAHFAGQPPEPTDQELHCTATRTLPILLNPGEQVTAASRQRVAQVQMQVPLLPETAEIVLLDISGEEVLCKPCSIPVTLLLGKQAPSAISCQQVRVARGPGIPEQRVGDFAYLDLAALPEGLYTVRQLDLDGGILIESKVLYTQAYPTPLAFLDLVLAKPNPDDTGLYPLCDLHLGAEQTRVVPLRAELRFERRKTRWCYFVVPPQGVRYDALRLLDVGSSQPVTFSGPVPVQVPGAGVTYRFIADQDLPLQEVPDYVFELQGTREQGLFESTLMSNVPVASPALVLPRVGPLPGVPRGTRPSGMPQGPRPSPLDRRDYSDIYLNL
ncbi:hypothetical protein [Myxococcus sp. CA039A]|uniref:hypothetical protein n=1 Tax=Myxococcus sp. CA039A TaxID=2741737 RepID=UPI00157AADD3|nr:hypothetical protein [Myxococcus sp. CA039A]NTX49735.1 hypothetical protein [Myxococcus sp. CA039A]